LGGGGSYSGPPSRTAEESERIFITAVEEVKHAAPKRHGIFISHAWDYDHYSRIENMLDEAEDFEYRNYSVPKHDPKHARTDRELEEALYNQIRPASVVIILAGMYANYRKWIQKEIDIAVEMGKPIIAVAPRGSQRMPQAVQEVADEIVGWNTASIVDAIRRLGNDRE
jgi:hypothetical protein